MGEMVPIHGKDFLMGSSPSTVAWLNEQANQAFPEEWFADETPQTQTTVAPFLIDKNPVTNEEFEYFSEETGYRTDAEKRGFGMVYGTYWEEIAGASWRTPGGPTTSNDGREDHPVVHISWNDAQAYATWAGKRLPSEAEWELAAKGEDDRLWPWGNEWQDNANTAELHAGELHSLKEWRAWWLGVRAVTGAMPQTTPVGTFSPEGDGPSGASDLAGNVYEWTSSVSELYDKAIDCDPTLRMVMGVYRVIRGGSWMNFRYQVRCAERMHGDPVDWSNFATGFRCAESVDEAKLIVPSAWAQRGGRSTFSLAPGLLGNVIQQFAQQNSAYTPRLLNTSGEPHRYYNTYINGGLVTPSQREVTPVAAADELTIVPPLAGG